MQLLQGAWPFVEDCPKLKKKNEKEKVIFMTEKKDYDDKIDELYIDKISLKCNTEVVEK